MVMPTVGAGMASVTVRVAASEMLPAASRVKAETVLRPLPVESVKVVGADAFQAASARPGVAVPATTAYAVTPVASEPPTLTLMTLVAVLPPRAERGQAGGRCDGIDEGRRRGAGRDRAVVVLDPDEDGAAALARQRA